MNRILLSRIPGVWVELQSGNFEIHNFRGASYISVHQALLGLRFVFLSVYCM